MGLGLLFGPLIPRLEEPSHPGSSSMARPSPSNAPSRDELPIIQATIDLIRWYVPLLNGLPRAHKFGLGDRIVANLDEVSASAWLGGAQPNDHQRGFERARQEPALQAEDQLIGEATRFALPSGPVTAAAGERRPDPTSAGSGVGGEARAAKAVHQL
jgi:hypothetical protein